MKKYKIICIFLILFTIILFISGEIAARFSGLLSFPLYERSSHLGYYLKNGQMGEFLNRNKWYVNNDGFNDKKEFSYQSPYTIITGDSIVYGGNPVDYQDRIGTLLQHKTKRDVWTAAAGGWSLENELRYLAARPAALNRAESLIIQYDAGDLAGLAVWQGEMVHPTEKPTFAFFYVVRRYLIPMISGSASKVEMPPIPESDSNEAQGWQRDMDDILKSFQGRMLFVLYPGLHAQKNPALWADQTRSIRRYIAGHSDRISVVDVAQLKGWGANRYVDGTHPDQAGREIISAALADWIMRGPQPAKIR